MSKIYEDWYKSLEFQLIFTTICGHSILGDIPRGVIIHGMLQRFCFKTWTLQKMVSNTSSDSNYT